MIELLGLAGRTVSLLGVGALIGLVANAARSDGVRLASFSATQTCAAPAPTPREPPPTSVAPTSTGAVEVLPPGETAHLCADARTAIVDVRPVAEFMAGHVTGALHLPCNSSGSVASAAVGLLTAKRAVIIYGDGNDDARAVGDAIARRASRPDLRVIVIDGGFPAWSQAGLACSSGPAPR